MGILNNLNAGIMKAVNCKKYGGPEVLEIVEIPQPTIKKNELLIRVKASAVNSADVRIRGLKVRGLLKWIMRFVLGFTRPRNPILGSVFAGTVEDIGENVNEFKKGDNIFGVTGLRMGAYAELMTIKNEGVHYRMPVNATYEEAAAILFGGMTAIYFLEKAGIEKDDVKDVLIYGATGSVGTASIQLAKYYNKRVTAVCGENGIELAKHLDADECLVYNKIEYKGLEKKYDVIFDAVGKMNKKDQRRLLKENGKFVTVGGLDVAKDTIEQVSFLVELFENNKYTAVIDKVYTLDDIIEAHRYVDSERKKGNVVIRI